MSKEEYYLGIANAVVGRGVCFRRFSGALIVREDQIVSTGFTGPPRKTKDCFERRSCMRDDLEIPSGQRYELCRSVHAEQNAVINAARAGVSLLGGDMYIYASAFATDPRDRKTIDAFPCFICKKMIINSGIDRVICSAEGGGFRVHRVEDWVEEWQRNDRDIVDDKHQYGLGGRI